MPNDSSSSEIRLAAKQVSLDSESHPAAKDSGSEANRETRVYTPPLGSESRAGAASSLVGARIGRYRIMEWRGRGGYGVVYRAQDSQSGREVAIKVLRDELCDAVAHRAAFEKEAATAKRLSHANLVQVYGVEHDEDRRPFIVEQFVDGGSLFEWAQAAPRSATDVVAMMIPVAEAVAYLHRSRLFHRDLKLNNILLDHTGKAYVSDFGLAIHESELVVREGEVAGTYGYMAPEQIRGRTKRVDGRTDIWSLGVILYELLTGRMPFGGVSRPSTSAEYYAILSEAIEENDPEPLRTFAPHLSRELEDICLRCLEKEKRHRFKTGDDLAEALRRFRDRQGGGKLDAEYLSPAAAVPAVVPKGLRAFDQADEAFFLDLLPGLRDRDGLPLCVSFWKERLSTTPPAGRLDVCVIYGPSGSGKSSLVKAGLVPQLGGEVRVLSVECNAHDTEPRLAAALRRTLIAAGATLSPETPLPALCEQVQQGALVGQKVVLVLDQFEQWLNSHPQPGGTELVQALECCNGTALQALLLVRDDFWMPLSRFTDELSISLREGENCAAVDLFDRAHARKVLMLFGRAYGRLPAREVEFSKDQAAFVNRAIDELAENDRIICVRLALFADLMSSRPWTIAEFEAVGGARGVGVKFLEDKFGPHAPVIYRTQRAAAQRVLAALLPPAGSALRGQMRTVEQLRASAELEERSFQSLLRLLDEDLKLITPTTPTGGTGEVTNSGQGNATAQYYQLTHDYLVPALGQWLTAELRRTRRGQALLRLRERSEDWNRRPEPRRLPTLQEWLAIHALVSRRRWTADERRMMSAANRRIGFRAAAIVLWVACALAVGWEVSGRSRARDLRDRVINFETSQVPAVLAEVAANPRGMRPLLEQSYREEFSARESDALATDPQQIRRRLHLSVALSSWDHDKLDYVLDHLNEVDPGDVPAVIEMTRPLESVVVDKAWSRLDKLADKQLKPDGSQTLALASLLAGLAPSNPRWDEAAAVVAKQLVAARAMHFSIWLKHLNPVAAELRQPLLDMWVHHAATGGERAQLLEAIARYATDEPVTLVAAVEEAAAADLPMLIAASRRAGGEFTRLASRRIIELSAKKPPVARISLLQLTDIAATLERYGGFLDNEAGYVSRLPLEEFALVSSALEKEGYRPECYRPFAQSGGEFVSATWRRDSRKSKLLHDLTPADVMAKNKAAADEGLEIRDLARDDRGHWSALWVAAKENEGEIRYYVDLPYQLHAERLEAWPKEDFYIERFDVHVPPGAAPLATAIWRKRTQETDEAMDISVVTRAGRSFGDLHPGEAQSDLRQRFLDPRARDRLSMYERASTNLREAAKERAAGERNNKLYLAARYQIRSGELEAALATLEGLKLPNYIQISEHRALVLLLLGRIEPAEKEIAHFESLITPRDAKAKEPLKRQFAMLLALLQGNVDAAAKALEQLEQVASTKDAGNHELLVQTLALFVRHQSASNDAKITALRQRAMQSLRELLLRRETKVPEELIEHFQIDGLRDDPAFAALLRELDIDRRFITVFNDRPDLITRQLFGLNAAQHDAAARKLRNGGFLPRIIGAAFSSDRQDLQISSVWEQPAPSSTQPQIVARKIAILATMLAALGDSSRLKAVLTDEFGIEARSWAIENAASAVHIAVPIQLLVEADSGRARQNFLRLVGTYDVNSVSQEDRRAVDEQTALPASDAAVQMAGVWLRRRWKLPEQSSTSGNDVDAHRQQWYRNGQGHTMIVLDLNEPRLMGSMSSDPEHGGSYERQHWVRVGRQVAMASTETTVGQFDEFLADPKVKAFYAKKEFSSSKQAHAPSSNCPQISVRWYDAARYCQWLSEKEGLPKSEWCFPEIWDVEDGSLELSANLVNRRGYRLPTEAEMELACRGGSDDARHFGNSPALLSAYAWNVANANRRTHEVGLLKPNDFGLFDCLGNAAEWCLNTYGPYRTPFESAVSSDEGSLGWTKVDSDRSLRDRPDVAAVLRGGNFASDAGECRSASRIRAAADVKSFRVGFRIARTVTKIPDSK